MSFGPQPVVVTNEEELRAVIGTPLPHVADKVCTRLTPIHRDWVAASPFCVVHFLTRRTVRHPTRG